MDPDTFAKADAERNAQSLVAKLKGNWIPIIFKTVLGYGYYAENAQGYLKVYQQPNQQYYFANILSLDNGRFSFKSRDYPTPQEAVDAVMQLMKANVADFVNTAKFIEREMKQNATNPQPTC